MNPKEQKNTQSRNAALREKERRLQSVEAELQAAYDKLNKLVEFNSDGIMVIDPEGTILFINPAAAHMFGRTESDLLGEQFGYPLTPGESTEIELLSGSGGVKVAELRTSKTQWEGKAAILVSLRDITTRKQTEQELRENEEELTAIYENAPLIMMLVDKERKIRKVNRFTGRFVDLSVEEMEGKRGGEALYCIHHLEDPRGCGFGPQCEQCTIRNTVLKTFETGRNHDHLEASLTLKRQDQHKEYTFLLSTKLLRHAEESLVLLTIMDITERKKAEENLRRMGFRDSMTNLYNRNFFEEEMNRLQDGRHSPIGIIICDVDGLKFINDTLGHQSGDEIVINIADILQKNFRASDIVARVGGDEFAILLPGVDQDIAEKLVRRLRRAVEDHNNTNPGLPVSLSIGYAVSPKQPVDMQALFREADDRMYRDKLQQEKSSRSAPVQALTKAIEARDFETEGHSERLKELATSLARAMDLGGDTANDLLLLAKFHDLGKVGIPDDILFKPGPLTEQEMMEMQKHSEIGYRIAQSVPDLAPIAELVLWHHERWDGQGYPQGLKGEEIPLCCRILAIVDAYDAMTSHRPYRKAVLPAEAVEELRRCAGSQFDPNLVEEFIKIAQDIERYSFPVS
ncbi:MAG: diguanylate cyclase [Desulfobacteraceae bacterium]|nr:diguanylate cyclase [Desulfobacteraceae bacterium]